MPALVPRTVIMIAEIEPYSQRAVHLKCSELDNMFFSVYVHVCAHARSLDI